MISLKQTVAQIKVFADNHWQIKKFGYEFKEQMPNLATVDEKYPYFFVVPIGATVLENVVEFELDCYCVDRLQKDRTNTNFIVSDTQLILTDFAVWLEDGDHELEVERSYPVTPINNDLLDYVSGWSMRIRVQVEKVSLCEVPMTDIFPDTSDCEPVLIYENGILVDTIPSGGTYSYVHGDAHYIITDTDGNILYSGDIAENDTLNQSISDSTAVLKTTGGATISTNSILAEASEDIVAPDATYLVEYQNGTDIQSGSIVSGGSVVVTVPDIIQTLTWELNYNGTDDVTYIIGTASNVGTLTSGSGSNVGTMTVSTDGVTYASLTFPFTPVAATTYYFKRSTATVNGTYTMVGTYV